MCGGSESVRITDVGYNCNWLDVISGFPQGTILGPLLFLLYVNNLPDQVQCQSKLFADDAKFFWETQTLADCALLQQDVNHLSAWTRNWQIQFNLEKCAIMRIRQSLRITYFIDGHPLTEVDQQNDLGVIVSNDLKPSKHVAENTKKANQRLGMTMFHKPLKISYLTYLQSHSKTNPGNQQVCVEPLATKTFKRISTNWRSCSVDAPTSALIHYSWNLYPLEGERGTFMKFTRV